MRVAAHVAIALALAGKAAAAPLFLDVTAASGIPSLKYAEGVSAVDLTNDGMPDLFLSNARGASRLFVNVGELRFRDETALRGLDAPDVVCATASDLSGDGLADLLLVRGMYSNAPSLLFIGPGGGAGKYVERGSAAGVDLRRNAIAAACADVDLDGRLDLYVSTWTGGILLRNVSAGGAISFEDATEAAELAGEGKGWGAVFADFSGDGLPDLFVARGTKGQPDPSRLYVNRGGGRFEDVTGASGVGGIRWGMGGVPADFDNDGDLDLFVTDFEGRDRLYRNDGAGHFTDVTAGSGIASGKSVGATVGDVDGDLIPDLIVAGFGEPLRAYRGLGGMKFRDASKEWGLEGTTRNDGVALVDLDGDGDLDLYVANYEGRNRLYKNTLDLPDFVTVRLSGLPNGGIGTTVRLLDAAPGGVSPPQRARVDVHGGYGFCSQGPASASFRLPVGTRCDLEIVLPGGRAWTVRDVKPGTIDAMLPPEERGR